MRLASYRKASAWAKRPMDSQGCWESTGLAKSRGVVRTVKAGFSGFIRQAESATWLRRRGLALG